MKLFGSLILVFIAIFVLTPTSAIAQNNQEIIDHPILKATEWIPMGTEEGYLKDSAGKDALYSVVTYFLHPKTYGDIGWALKTTEIFGELVVKEFVTFEPGNDERYQDYWLQVEKGGIWYTFKMPIKSESETEKNEKNDIVAIIIILTDDGGKEIFRRTVKNPAFQ